MGRQTHTHENWKLSDSKAKRLICLVGKYQFQHANRDERLLGSGTWLNVLKGTHQCASQGQWSGYKFFGFPANGAWGGREAQLSLTQTLHESSCDYLCVFILFGVWGCSAQKCLGYRKNTCLYILYTHTHIYKTSPAAKTRANCSYLLSCLDSCLPPAAPQQPHVTVVSDSEVALSWKPGESEGSSPIQYYSVEFIR